MKAFLATGKTCFATCTEDIDVLTYVGKEKQHKNIHFEANIKVILSLRPLGKICSMRHITFLLRLQVSSYN